MGLFDSIKSLAIKAKCATGFHSGTFERVNGKPECYFEKTCPDCNKLVTTHKHAFPDTVDYDNHHSCTKTYTCAHCKIERREEKHEQYKEISKDSYCRWKERCVRCGHERLGQEDHDWTKAAGGTYEDQHEKYFCSRCHKEETRRKIKH